MKRSTKAAAFSFVIPGAGLWYLGESRQSIVNLIGAAVLSAIVIATGHEHLHWGLLAIAAGSSGYAHAAARALQQPPGVERPGDSDHSTKARC
jgi:predicted metal-dependent enzyme (double-stranded beta helix superfamily)